MRAAHNNVIITQTAITKCLSTNELLGFSRVVFFVDLSGVGVRKQKGEDSSRNNGCCVGGTTQQLVLKNQEVDSKNFEGLYNISHVFVKN